MESDLDRIISGYLIATENGDAISVETLCAQHPEHETAIQSYFRQSEKLVSSLGTETPAESFEIEGYELGEEIGRGGMGVVFAARQISLDRQVAVKILRDGRLSSESIRARFDEEARLVGRLKHPNIVDVLEFGRVKDRPYLVMPLLDGQSLQDAIRNEPLPEHTAVRIMLRVADAIQYAHEQGIIHRDIKPANIVGNEHNCQVTDFGLAFYQDSNKRLTGTGDVIGTPGFLAPEIIRGQSRGDVTTDVYAMGATLYSLLVGQPPHRAASSAESMLLALQGEPAEPRKLNRLLSADINSITLNCLHADPRRRYKSVKEFQADLERLQAGKPVQARPVSAFNKLRRWSMRNKALAATIFVASLLAVGLIGGGIYSYQQVSLALAAQTQSADNARTSLNNALATLREFYKNVGDTDVFNDTPESVEFRNKLLRDGTLKAEELLQNNAENPDVLRELADIYMVIGNVHSGIGKIKESEVAFLKANEIYTGMWTEVSDRNLTDRYIDCLTRLCATYANSAEFDKLERYENRSIAVAASLERFSDPTAKLRSYQLQFQRMRGLDKRGRGAEILEEAEECVEKFDALAAEFPNDSAVQFATSQTHLYYGIIQIRSNPDEAAKTHIQHWRLGAEYGNRCVELDPENVAFQRQRMNCTANELGAVAREGTVTPELLQRQIDEVITYFRSLSEKNPANVRYRLGLMRALADTAVLATPLNKELAREYAQQTLELFDDSKNEVSDHKSMLWAESHKIRRIALGTLAQIAREQDNLTEAIRLQDLVVADHEAVFSERPADSMILTNLTVDRMALIQDLLAAAQWDKIRRQTESTVGEFEQLAPRSIDFPFLIDIIDIGTGPELLSDCPPEYRAKMKAGMVLFASADTESDPELGKRIKEIHARLDSVP